MKGAAVAVLLAVLVACSMPDEDVEVSDGWARPTTDVVETAAVYLTLKNNLGAALTLISAESDRCETLQVHETTVVDGVMSMREIPMPTIPPGTDLVMAPGGAHLMCLGLDQPLEQDDRFEVRLVFDPPLDVTTEVKVENR